MHHIRYLGCAICIFKLPLQHSTSVSLGPERPSALLCITAKSEDSFG